MPFITSAIPIVDTAGLSRADWLDYRRTGIGGSDLAAIMGLSGFGTARDIYYSKIGELDAIDTDDENWFAKEYGNALEPLAVKTFEKMYDLDAFVVHKMFRHPVHEFMIADVDGFVKEDDGSRSILECKSTGTFNRDAWENGAVPYNYELQCRHYMAVMNLNRAYIICIMGNTLNDVYVRVIERDMEIEEAIIQEEQYFWEEHVLKRIPVPYTESGDLVLKSIRKHYGTTNNSAVALSTPAIVHLDEYLELKAKKKLLDAQVKDVDNEMKKAYAPVLDLMRNSPSATCIGAKAEYLISNNSVIRKQISGESLEKLRVRHPEIYKEYLSETESRRFSVKVKELVV